jgi:uncharacterized protein YndB with AHSA1/START domain
VIVGDAVVHEAEYPHPPARVWRALVEPAELDVWLMPNDFVAEAGRTFTFHADSLGEINGEVLAIDVERRLTCRWSGVFGDTVVEYQLTPTDGGTRLRVEHRGWGDRNVNERDGFDGGWHEKLTKDLPAVLEGVA